MAKPLRSMVLNRNLILDSTYGHSVRFEKDKPTPVPPIMYSLALGIGAAFVDGAAAVAEDKAGPVEILDPAERTERLLEIVTMIYDRNNGEDFTAGAKPKASAVSKEFGFEVTSQEVSKIVVMYHEAQAAAKAG